MRCCWPKIVLEAFVGSFGILIFGFVSIPLVGYFVGADITMDQGFGMSIIFFIARIFWLVIVRRLFINFER